MTIEWSGLVIWVTIAANVGMLLVLLSLATSVRWGEFRNSIGNPMLFVALLMSVFLVDFVVLLGDGRVRLFELQRQFSGMRVLEAFAYYTGLSAAFVMGMVLAVREPMAPRPVVFLTSSRKAARVVLWMSFVPATAAAALLIASLPDILSGKMNRQLLFAANPLLLIALGTVVPSLAIFFGNATVRSAWSRLLLLHAVVLILLTGSRGSLFLVGLVVVVALAMEGKRLRAYLYIPAIPAAVILLTTLRYIFRESWRYDSMASFIVAKGGISNIFFKGAEIGLADAFTILFHDLASYSRPPFESFIGVLMYPLPRALFPFKPVSASAVLTESLSPRNWALTKSEILASGYGDLMMQFGLVGAVLASAVIGYFWTRACLRAVNSDALNSIVVLPALLYCFYIGYRGAFFNLGAILWPFAITLVGYRVVSWWLRAHVDSTRESYASR